MDQKSNTNNHASEKPLAHPELTPEGLTQESIDAQASARPDSESLFEHYEPRTASIILSQKNERQKSSIQAQLDSQAAEAAAIILDGVEPPEFTFDQDITHHQLLPTASQQRAGQHSKQEAKAIRVQKTSLLDQLRSPGAQFVYALVIITLLAGLIGLAASTDSPLLVLIAGIASPMLLPICIWKWIRWLDSTPYYYRLLTSLGEDARNLLNYRLLWKRSH